MSQDDAIQVDGTVVEVLSGTLYRVELPNGHRLLAYVPGRLRTQFVPMAEGEKVRVQLSPFDLSQGRILKD